MKKKMNINCILVTFLLLIGLTACTADKTPENNSPAETPSVTASLYPMTITNSYGEEITIEKEPMKIISISPSITEVVFELGLGERLAARSDYCDYPPEATDVQSIGNIRTPNIEMIMELNPDLVLTSAHFNSDVLTMLQELGITVLAIYDDQNFEGSFSMVETVGLVLNREDHAKLLVEKMKNTIDDVVTRVNGLEKPNVYYVVSFGEFGDYTAGGDTFIGQLIEMAGANNIAAEVTGWSYNLESLLEADPDIIVVSMYFDSKVLFEAGEGYKTLKAVTEGRVYEIDNNMLDRQGLRNADGLKALAEIFHPEAFK